MQKTAVVIDDDQDVRGLIQGILEGTGLEVHGAGTGAAGVETVRQQQPDIIVLDFGLPDFNGLETARRIRGFSSAPILMLTGHEDLADTPFSAGVQDLMAKPFSPRELRLRVEKMLSGHERTTATGTEPA